MRPFISRAWMKMIHTTAVAAGFVALLAGAAQPAWAVIDIPGETLAKQCALAEAITVLRVERVNREKKGIVYRKVRDLKGVFAAPRKIFGETFTHVIRENPNPTFHRQDIDNQDLQNEAIVAWAAEGKAAVVFQRGGEQAICVGHAWYTARSQPPAQEHWVEAAGADSRFLRLFCGDVDELIAAIPGILAGKEVTVPRMIGTINMVSDGTGPIRGIGADKPEPQRDAYTPFHWHAAPWGTHRGNPQRTGADGGPGPKSPKVLWAHESRDQFVAPLVPDRAEIFASSLGANGPLMRALALDPADAKRERWSRSRPALDQPVVAEPVFVSILTGVLIFGDGTHESERASLHCLRARDGFPLWRLPIAAKSAHFEGTPTVAGTPSNREFRLFVGGGGAGVLCVNPASTPKLVWQQGQGKWHVDAPVAVVENRVLAASAYLEDEKVGERALICLNADDGSVVWKTPLKLNPWAGPTVGPYVLVGCSSTRRDRSAIPGASGEIVAVELDTGKVRWRKDVPGGVLSAVAVKAGTAIFTATDGKVRAWDAFTGQEKWIYDAKEPFFAGPAVTDQTVYAADLKGVVHAISLADGKRKWLLDLTGDQATKITGTKITGTKITGMVYGSPLVHGGRLYVGTCSFGQEQGGTPNAVVCVGEK